MNNIEKLYKDLCDYKSDSIEEKVLRRLNKTLEVYISNLDLTIDRIKNNDSKKIIKELSK